ncbi:cathepsin L3-like protein [Leptotrombidium deliense]|uniref:Cathepsin L3-like protein n=1 Tax=Leptotrombidium deliense TaxID=299467 RepID=A0A443SN29_9ACAR|nr:cathepsin L3-like protein [Leptotrombidium deliense]
MFNFFAQKKHGKRYHLKNEEMRRKAIFFSNLRKIIKSNLEADLGMKSYRLSVNNFADMTNAEFKTKMTGLRHKKPVTPKLKTVHKVSATNVKASVDWREKMVVTPVMNQGECGSCWAFSAASALETHTALKTGKLVQLSAQHLIDCDDDNDGCEGGLMNPAFEYVKQNNGLATDASYPYEERKGKCRYRNITIGASCRGYIDIAPYNENLMRDVVATTGPVCVGIDGDSLFFQFYASGVYDDFYCSKDPNHGILIVGYGTSNRGKDFWIIKNSWGKDWGENGFGLIARNKNMCGIATMPSYPVV